jgi:hypothetical protein
MSHRRTITVAALLVASLAGLGGCGDEKGDGGASAPTTRGTAADDAADGAETTAPSETTEVDGTGPGAGECVVSGSLSGAITRDLGDLTGARNGDGYIADDGTGFQIDLGVSGGEPFLQVTDFGEGGSNGSWIGGPNVLGGSFDVSPDGSGAAADADLRPDGDEATLHGTVTFTC